MIREFASEPLDSVAFSPVNMKTTDVVNKVTSSTVHHADPVGAV